MLSKLHKFSTPSLLMVPHLARISYGAVNAASDTLECHSETCHPIDEYCSQFEQKCMPCSRACDPNDVKYEPEVCSQKCTDFIKFQPLKNEIHQIQMQQNVILILLILLLAFTAAHFAWKLLKWLKQKRCFSQLIKRLQRKKESSLPTAYSNGKDLGGTTIPNMNAINDIERMESQMQSSTAVDGSESTVTTSIGTRHPAENTTPSPQPNEYSYDNKGLVVTPVYEKPSGGSMFP